MSEFAVGDAVLGWAMLASYAEHVVVGVDEVVRKPANMPWPQAGVLSASGQTAPAALRALGVRAGETVLIHAAAGGVGTFAVQIASRRGATVIGTASVPNHGYLRELGAIPVAYGDGLADRVRAAAPDGIGAALDGIATEDSLRASLELVADRGRIGTVAFSTLAAQLGIARLSTERSVSQLQELVELYAQGELQVVVQHAYPLEEAANAHRAVETRHVRGKIVLATR